MKAIGYVRVSTGKQEISPEAQAAKIRAWAQVKSADLVDIIIDKESGKDLDRPGMTRLLELVDTKACDIVIIAKLDRLTRSVRDLDELLQRFGRRDVALVSSEESLDTSSAAGRLVLNIMTAVAQWEREAIGERTREALQHKKKNGERVGTIPYGYQVDHTMKRLVPNLAEQEVIKSIRLCSQEGCTTREIAKLLNDARYRTREGGLWRHEYVARVLRSAA